MAQNNSNLIRGFSKAIFTVANEFNAKEQFLLFLEFLNKVIQNTMVKKILKNSAITSENKTDFLLELVKGIESTTKPQFVNFIALLSKKKLLLLLPSIYEHYDKLYLEQENKLRVTITSAVILDDEQKQTLVANLTKYFNKTLLLIYKIDASIIAGLTIKYNDALIDYSLKGQLLNLHYMLKND